MGDDLRFFEIPRVFEGNCILGFSFGSYLCQGQVNILIQVFHPLLQEIGQQMMVIRVRIAPFLLKVIFMIICR